MVYFRVFDVDDPFDQNNAAMPSVALIDSDMSGPDNRGGADPAVGTYSATTDATGQARVPITVSMQPGNNYRAAASVLQDARTQTTIYNGQTVTPQQHADALAANWSGYSVPLQWSQMLTVWRKLHVERDTMVAPVTTDFRVDSEITAVYPTPTWPGTTTVEIACPVGNPNPDENNYEGGAITFINCPTGADVFGIMENYPCNEFSPYRIIVLGAPGPCAAVGTGCSFYDDDDMQALGTIASPRFPEGGTLLTDAFRPAYIDPTYADAHQSVVPFEVYLNYWEILSGEGSWNSSHTLTSSTEFWSAFILGAWEGSDDRFETSFNGDGDPDGTPLVPGPIAPGQEVALTGVRRIGTTEAIVFFQAIVDEADNGQTDEAHTIVHEIGHTCGDLIHKDLTIMQEGAPKSRYNRKLWMVTG